MDLEGGETNISFNKFVLSTCNPSHVKIARRGVDDWMQVSQTEFASQSTGFVHDCQPHTCNAWVLRFVDGVKICAISGKMYLKPSTPSPARQEKKRTIIDSSDNIKRHQDKPVPGSSAYLMEKFNLDGNTNGMEVDQDSPLNGRNQRFF